ncbi:WXG100 family type VII secretion target [Micromonospora okii]|uniref:WXG100 family type VII secretion target n=1 Tax=Micromonospora okii TaxID=1182970 RepID=UPI001E36D1BC|nr:WXG100 family type VII secretion target [Micromonospora okii]
MSEYTARYEHVSHEKLYEAVNAGDPAQIDGLAAKWNSMKGTLDDLARDLRGDLDKLANGWTGDAGREFQRRLSLVVDYSTTLSEGMADVRQGLTLMATHLRTAKKEAESPEETDDHDQAVSGAVKGGVTFGLPGAIVGGIMGHQQDKAEQERAHKRMVKVVAELAAGYDLSAYGRLVDPPKPDRDLPYDPNTTPSTPSTGPGARKPGSAPNSRKGSPRRDGKTAPDPQAVLHGPGPGNGTVLSGVEPGGTHPGPGPVHNGPGTTPGAGTDPGTSLAGADPVLGGTPPTGGTTGGVGLGGATATAAAGAGAGLLFGARPGAPAGGVLGGGTGSLAGSTRAAAPMAAKPAGGPPMTEHRPATSVGRFGGNGANNGAANRAGVLGGAGRTGEDDSDERLTWLTEDEMVWSDGETGAPPVLGAS